MSYGKFRPDVTVYSQYTEVEPKDFDDYENFTWDCKNFDNMFEMEMATLSTIDRTPGLKDKAKDATDIVLLYNKVPCIGDKYGQGWAAVGGSGGSVKIKGVTNIDLDGSSLSTITTTFMHEIGHSIGFEHANASCRYDNKKCEYEYLNPYNIMGGRALARSKTIINPLDDALNQQYTADYFDTADSLSVGAQQKIDVGWIPKTDEVDFYSSKEKEDLISRGLYSPENALEGSANISLNALWQSQGTRSIELDMLNSGPYYIEYRPKAKNGIDYFDSGKLSDGLLVYNSSYLMNGKQDGNTYKINDDTYYDWDYSKAAIKEPFKLTAKSSNADDTICIIPSNFTEEGVDITIRSGSDCDNYEYSSEGYIGGEDSSFKPIWSYETNDKNTRTQTASSTCYDDNKNLLFVTSIGQVLIYKLKSNGFPEDNKADWVLGARKAGEVYRDQAGWGSTPHYTTWTFVGNSPSPKPQGTVYANGAHIACDSKNSRLFIADHGNDGKGVIKVFDYSQGLQDGMDASVVFGQDIKNGYLGETRIRDLGYSERYNTLVIVDSTNKRILGYTLPNQITSSTSASWVLGQADLITPNTTGKDAISTFGTAINDTDGKLYLGGMFFNDFNNGKFKLRQYSIENLQKGNQNYEQELTPSDNHYFSSIVFDETNRRLIVAEDTINSGYLSARNIKTYKIDESTKKLKTNPSQTIKWNDKPNTSTREDTGAWTLNTKQQVIYRACVRYSMFCNHYDIFRASIASHDKQYKTLSN